MINILSSKSKSFKQQLLRYLDSRKPNNESKIRVVKKIISEVKKEKDQSLLKYEKKFSNLKKLNKKDLFFTKSEMDKIIKSLDIKTKNSINIAFKRIYKFHKNQKFKDFKVLDSYKNSLSYRSMPLEKVGVYVPGGVANYPSSVLMNCIPAIVAGVKKIYLTAPCIGKKINPGVIYAAKKCKVKEIYKLGGAQAIAAFAYGTQKVKKVDKLDICKLIIKIFIIYLIIDPCIYMSIKKTDNPGNAKAIVNLNTVLTFIIGVYLFKQKYTYKNLLLILLIVIFTLLLR